MPHVSEFHHHVGGLTAGAVARARAASSRAQDTFNTRFLSYWFDEGAVMIVDGVGSYRSDVVEPYPSSDVATPLLYKG